MSPADTLHRPRSECIQDRLGLIQSYDVDWIQTLEGSANQIQVGSCHGFSVKSAYALVRAQHESPFDKEYHIQLELGG